jgi:peptidyl-prolyl cis-trans isomerase SurA
MISKDFIRGCAIAAAALLASVAMAQTREASSSGVLLDRIAATVNDGVVLQSELDEQMIIITERLKDQKLELPPQNVLRKQVLDRLVLQELQMQRANRAGIKVSDETLNNALNDVASQNHIKLADLPDALSAQGIDYAGYRETLRKELAMQILRQRDVSGRHARAAGRCAEEGGRGLPAGRRGRRLRAPRGAVLEFADRARGRPAGTAQGIGAAHFSR